MEAALCATCGRPMPEAFGFSLVRLLHADDFDYRVDGPHPWAWSLCSVGCLTEWAWQLREAQPKLSKSKHEDAPDGAPI